MRVSRTSAVLRGETVKLLKAQPKHISSSCGSLSLSLSLSHGCVSPGFEPVKDMFEAMLRSGCDRRAQLCVFMGEERTVDLWGTAADIVDDHFGPDSLLNVFSSTKTITAIVVAKMVDKGLLSYDAKVVDYWPEFGAHGKDELTVADVLRHEGGLSKFDTQIAREDITRQKIKENKVGVIIERQKLVYRDDSPYNRREYHAITRDWIINEIVRRADPEGRTIGEILQSEICDQLGQVDAFIGLAEKEMGRVTPVQNASVGYMTKQSLIPAAMGREIDLNFFQLVVKFRWLAKCMKQTTRQNDPPEMRGMRHMDVVFNDEKIRAAEIPSANGHASARGMATLASMMANDGVFNQTRILSPSTIESFHSEAVEADMLFAPNYFVKGGVAVERIPVQAPPSRRMISVEGIEECHGWIGYGGSVIQWHPETKIGFAFVPSFLYWLDIANVRGKKLLAEVIRCARLRSS